MNTNKITNTNSEKKTTGKDKKIIHQLTAWSTCGTFIIVISIIFDVLYSGGVIHTNRLSLIFRIIGLAMICITTIIMDSSQTTMEEQQCIMHQCIITML